MFIPCRFVQAVPAQQRKERFLQRGVISLCGGRPRGNNIHSAAQKRNLGTESFSQPALHPIARNRIADLFAYGKTGKQSGTFYKSNRQFTSAGPLPFSVHISELTVFAQTKLFLHFFPAFLQEILFA